VDFTSNGILGLGKLRHCRPDILLVESKLCGLSGLELIKAARAEPAFGDRPIFVFTHVDRLSRAARKEVGHLATELLDKSVVTREDVVQIFTNRFLNVEAPHGAAGAIAATQPIAEQLEEVISPGALQELINGVREQADVLTAAESDREANGGELLSRVSSLASCATAAGMADLSRHAKALENLLAKLSHCPEEYSDAVLSSISMAVEVMSLISVPQPGQKGRLSKLGVVFADESAFSSRAMEDALRNAGFEPVCFDEPTRAREYLACHKTDLIMVNVALPEAHGLALADVRQMPLHITTPVLFAPERTTFSPSREELPTSAARLDKSGVLLAHMIVIALNEVQTGAAKPARATRKQAPPVATAPVQSVSLPSPAEDHFELFGPGRQQSEAVATPLAPQLISAPHLIRKNGAQLNDLFSAAGIPNAPIMRAEASPSGEDEQADQVPVLPVESNDNTLIEERPFEAPQQFSMLPESPPPAEMEAAANEAFATGAPPLEAAGDGNAIFVSNHGQAEVDPAADPSTQETSAVNDGQNMNTELLGLSEHRAQARCAELEQEVAALRQALEGLNTGFVEQQSSPDLQAQVQKLEERLGEKTAELEQALQERQRAEADLQKQLEFKDADLQRQHALRQEAETQRAQLEQELAKLRQEREASAQKKAQNGNEAKSADGKAPLAGEWSGLSPSELEQQVRQSVAALAKATAELAKERGERQRSQQLAADLNTRLQTLHQDFSRTLSAQGEHLARISSLEQRTDEAEQALERKTAELEQQQGERAALEEQLKKNKDSSAQLRKDLAFFEEANKRSDAARFELQGRLESSLNAVREHEARLHQETAERKRLAEDLESTRRDVQEQSRKNEILEQELKTANDSLRDRDQRLEKETAERQRLAEALEKFQRGSLDHPDRDLEFSKVQSALQNEQVERKRQETQLARMRQTAIEAAHAARTLRTGLRRQIREPVDNLVQSTRNLLELEMGEEQKRIAEAVLQDVLMVQTRLREPSLLQPDGAETPPAPNKA